MVPALLYMLFKKLRKLNWAKMKRNLISRLFIRSNQVIITLVILLLLFSVVLAAQKQSLNYKVMRKGSEIGWVSLTKIIMGKDFTINMASEVSIKFVFSFSSAAKELSEFHDGKMHHSYFYRKTNGNVKAERHTRLAGNSYEVEDKAIKKMLNIPPVTFNTLSMYFREPAEQKRVYSDNYQCFLDIEKKSDGGYRISFPDGNSNTFYYISGVCYKVKIEHSFYSAVLILK